MLKIFEIFYRFFLLGCISFGGPVAHIAYFKSTFVDKLKWLDEQSYSKIVALSQFLPGPSSSQVGFTIGLKQGGIIGAVFVFIGFTLPSFLILYFLFISQIFQNQNEYILALISALKLLAVVVVLDAIYSMFKSFCKDKITIFIFLFVTAMILFFDNLYNQMIALLISAFIGFIFITNEEENENKKIKYPNIYILTLFIFLFFVSFLFKNDLVILFSKFYEAGSMVFGGGHVVLPLLQDKLSSDISTQNFLLAYSLAQAVPGPMFTIATYLGALMGENAFLSSLVATLAIFLPGFLLILAFYNSFESISKNKKILSIMIAVNAGVVGLLFGTLIDVIIPSSIYDVFDFLIVVFGLFLLRFIKINILYLIMIFITISFLGVYYV